MKATVAVEPLGRAYKAIVVLFFHGGIDSYNVLVPHSSCVTDSGVTHDMYAEYEQVRGDVKIAKGDLLQITDTRGQQMCGTFGLHPKLPALQSLFADAVRVRCAQQMTLVLDPARSGATPSTLGAPSAASPSAPRPRLTREHADARRRVGNGREHAPRVAEHP